jgi:hypothetical protein
LNITSWTRAAALWIAVAGLGGCASVPQPGELAQTPWAALSKAEVAAGDGQWQHHSFTAKRPTAYRYERARGRDALAARSSSSASAVRRLVNIAPEALGSVRFSWFVPALIEAADMSTREGDDGVVRVILAFDGDRSKLSARDAMLSELSRAITGEELPYATLMYVWGNERSSGSVIVHPRTERVRKIVVESGTAQLNRWLDYERDIRADFERAFGEPPGALRVIAVMTDTDNTRSVANAWYGPVSLGKRPGR